MRLLPPVTAPGPEKFKNQVLSEEALADRIRCIGISGLRLAAHQGYGRWNGVPGRIRTRDPLLRRQPLYPLSYWDVRLGSTLVGHVLDKMRFI